MGKKKESSEEMGAPVYLNMDTTEKKNKKRGKKQELETIEGAAGRQRASVPEPVVSLAAFFPSSRKRRVPAKPKLQAAATRPVSFSQTGKG